MDGVRQDLSPILSAFPRERKYLLPALERVQEELRFLPLWALETIGQHLRVPKSEVYGVATHYPEFHLDSLGRHVVRVCTGLSCRVLGAGEIVAAIEARLAVQAGQTSSDGTVTLEESSCAFICGVAPVVEVDGVAHGMLSAERADALVAEAVSR